MRNKELYSQLFDTDTPDDESNPKIVRTKIGSWEINTLNRDIVLSRDIQDQGACLVDRWADVFPQEPTWIQANFGVPSIIVRIDGIDNDGELGVYEIEERPAGIGHTTLINTDFARRLNDIKTSWPMFDVVVSPLRDKEDDKLWNPVVDLDSTNKLVYVRAEPEEERFHSLQAQSVSTIVTEGDKSYGVPLELWKFIDSPDQFPSHQSFVLKPLQSSKGRNMAFYDVRKRPGPGNVKMKNAAKLLREQTATKGGMYIQELIPPMNSGIETHPFMIYRFFFGYDIPSGQWVSLGGTYFGRNNLKIHGASDSLSGPLIVG